MNKAAGDFPLLWRSRVFCLQHISTSTLVLSSWISLFFQVDIFYVYGTTFSSWDIYISKVINPSTGSRWNLWRISCCVFTRVHSDIMWRLYWGSVRRSSRECPQQLTWTFALSHSAPPVISRRLSRLQFIPEISFDILIFIWKVNTFWPGLNRDVSQQTSSSTVRMLTSFMLNNWRCCWLITC